MAGENLPVTLAPISPRALIAAGKSLIVARAKDRRVKLDFFASVFCDEIRTQKWLKIALILTKQFKTYAFCVLVLFENASSQLFLI